MRSWRLSWVLLVLVTLLAAGCSGVRATPTAIAVRPTLTPEPGPRDPVTLVPSDTPVQVTPTSSPSATPQEPAPVPPTPAATPTELPTVTPLLPASSADWSTWTNDVYGFTLRYPADWVLEEEARPNATMRGHSVRLWPGADPDSVLTINYRAAGEQMFIGRTGVGAGELVEREEVVFVGEPVRRVVLVARERDMSVLYAGGRVIARGDLAFTMYLDYRGDPEGTALSEETQAVADQIVASVAK